MMAVADQDGVRFLDVGGLEAERRIEAAAIEIGIEQHDLPVMDELEIGIAGPAHRERARILWYGAAGRGEHRRMAGGIARLGLKRCVGIDGGDAIRTWVFEWACLRGQRGSEGGDRNAGNEESLGAHDVLPELVVGAVGGDSAVM